ncbi:MAG: DCC1-like thiol-disulfide oxidoreductase family protein [Verrucomicrobiota bacterium]
MDHLPSEPQFLPAQTVTGLYLFYDGHCPLCSLIQRWLARQPTRVPLALVPHQHPRAREIFPPLCRLHPQHNLLLLTNTGFVHTGPDALRSCLANLTSIPLPIDSALPHILYHIVHRLRAVLRFLSLTKRSTP